MTTTSYTIEGFPDDQKERVVWWYGALHLGNNSTEPVVDIALRPINNKELLDESSIHKVALSQLDLVRIGSIWKGRVNTENFWENYAPSKYGSSTTFEFNFIKNPNIECGSFLDSGPSDKPGFIYRGKYSFGCIPNEPARMFNDFRKSNLTRFTSIKGVEVFVPCLELFTSTYTPEEKDIRRLLFASSIDNVLSNYLDMDKCYEKNNKYFISPKRRKSESNIVFLAHLALNQETRNRVSQIWPELQKQSKSIKSQARNPFILPFHSHYFKFRADGIWLDDNYRSFLVLRINTYSLPTEKGIVLEFDEQEYLDGETKASVDRWSQNETIHKVDLPNTCEVDPNSDSGVIYVMTQVECFPDKPKIETTTKYSVPESDDNLKFLNEEEPTQSSSGEQNSSKDSKGTAKLKQIEPFVQPTDEDRINDSEILKAVNDALISLKAGDHATVQSISYLDIDGTEHNIITLVKCPEFKDTSNIQGWPRLTSNTFRSFLLLKIRLGNSKSAYLLEIQRKKSEAGFSGLIFNSSSALGKSQINDLLKGIAINKGNFKHRVKPPETGPMIENTLPQFVAFKYIYDHSPIQDCMVKKMRSVIANAEKTGVFR